jgi:hypothetical protein
MHATCRRPFPCVQGARARSRAPEYHLCCVHPSLRTSCAYQLPRLARVYSQLRASRSSSARREEKYIGGTRQPSIPGRTLRMARLTGIDGTSFGPRASGHARSRYCIHVHLDVHGAAVLTSNTYLILQFTCQQVIQPLPTLYKDHKPSHCQGFKPMQ